MRNLLAFIGGVVVLVGGLGWYLGWFKVQKQPGGEPGTSRFQIDVDQSKFQSDAQRLLQAGQEKAGQLVQPKPATTGPAPATTGPTPPAAPTFVPPVASPTGLSAPAPAPKWRPASFWP